MMMYKDVVKMFLPAGLLEHFDITDVVEEPDKSGKDMDIYISLEEKNELPSGYSPKDYESKGFYAEKTIQDFPIRGKAVYLRIKRRRWRLKSDKNTVITTDYSFIAEGVKLTKELVDFLKGTGRDPSRYD